MKVDLYVDRVITKSLFEEVEKDAEKHNKHGKLSASQMGYPLQWQILKARGIKPAPHDGYTLRKFKRGNQVEDWFISQVPDVVDTQKTLEYRTAIGRCDAIVDTKDWDFNVGIIPVEVKSVTNANFKHIQNRKESTRGHMLQAGFYARALQKDFFAIAYIASDDYRVRMHIHNVCEIEEELDGIITTFQTQLDTGVVPVFAPKEAWHSLIKYNPYPEWAKLSDKEITKKMKEYESTSN